MDSVGKRIWMAIGKRNGLAWNLTMAGAVLRLLPHPPNVSPVGGMSLFAGAKLRGWRAYAVPVLLMLVTDPLLSVSRGFAAFSLATPFIYASFLINVWIGRRFLANRVSPARLVAAVLAGSIQFFLITNAVWFQIGGTYPYTLAGLMASYVAALPFFGRTLAGDLVYSGLLFGLSVWLSRAAEKRAAAEAAAQPAR